MASHPTPKRNATWRALWTRTASYAAAAKVTSGFAIVCFRLGPALAPALAITLATALAPRAAHVASAAEAGAAATNDVRALLARYQRATADPGAAEMTSVETTGALTGAGLAGAFHTWHADDRERTDQNLGPRSERTLRIGKRIWYADADGDVREFTGILARRARTEHFIDSGEFAKAPERCVARGAQLVDGTPTFALDVTAEDGETETLYLDAKTALPARIGYDDDDGRTTIDFDDWRTVRGHRFPYKIVVSNGDRAYDTTQTTTNIDIGTPIDAALFAPFVARRIEMDAPQTVVLEASEGHLYAPVTIGARKYTFLLDSGAQNIVIDKRLVGELGISAVGALEASGATRTGGLQLAKLDELAIGTGRLHDIVATTIDLGASTGGAFRIDGILGFPFFASATVRLDPANKAMTFGPPGSVAPLGERMLVELDRAFPETVLRVNGKIDAPFIIDTGNAAQLLLYKPFVLKHAGLVPYTLTTRHSYGIGGATESLRTSLEQIDFGSVPLYHVETDVMQATRGAFADRFDAGNVGLGLLDNFITTFDLANSALYFERGSRFDDGRARR